MDTGVFSESGSTEGGWSKAQTNSQEAIAEPCSENKGTGYVSKSPPSRGQKRPSSRRRRPTSRGRTILESRKVDTGIRKTKKRLLWQIGKSNNKLHSVYNYRGRDCRIKRCCRINSGLVVALHWNLSNWRPSHETVFRRSSSNFSRKSKLTDQTFLNSLVTIIAGRSKKKVKVSNSRRISNPVAGDQDLKSILFLEMEKNKKSKKGSAKDHAKRKNSSLVDRTESLNTTKRTREGDNSADLDSTPMADRTCVAPPSYYQEVSADRISGLSPNASDFFAALPTTSSPNRPRYRQNETSIVLDHDEIAQSDDDGVQQMIDSINEQLDLGSSAGTVKRQDDAAFSVDDALMEEENENELPVANLDEEEDFELDEGANKYVRRSDGARVSLRKTSNLTGRRGKIVRKVNSRNNLSNMAARTPDVAPENKVTVYLQGYPAAESIIIEAHKDILINYLQETVQAMEEAARADGVQFVAPLFPSIQPKHGQLEIGCDNQPGVRFVLDVFGPGVDHVSMGLGRAVIVERTLDVTNSAPSFLLTTAGDVTWETVLQVCSSRLAMEGTDTWIKLKEVKLDRPSGVATRFAILMPHGQALRDRLLALPEPEQVLFPHAERKTWIFRYQMTEREIGKSRRKLSMENSNKKYFQWPATQINGSRSEWRLRTTFDRQLGTEFRLWGVVFVDTSELMEIKIRDSKWRPLRPLSNRHLTSDNRLQLSVNKLPWRISTNAESFSNNSELCVTKWKPQALCSTTRSFQTTFLRVNLTLSLVSSIHKEPQQSSQRHLTLYFLRRTEASSRLFTGSRTNTPPFKDYLTNVSSKKSNMKETNADTDSLCRYQRTIEISISLAEAPGLRGDTDSKLRHHLHFVNYCDEILVKLLKRKCMAIEVEFVGANVNIRMKNVSEISISLALGLREDVKSKPLHRPSHSVNYFDEILVKRLKRNCIAIEVESLRANVNIRMKNELESAERGTLHGITNQAVTVAVIFRKENEINKNFLNHIIPSNGWGIEAMRTLRAVKLMNNKHLAAWLEGLLRSIMGFGDGRQTARHGS